MAIGIKATPDTQAAQGDLVRLEARPTLPAGSSSTDYDYKWVLEDRITLLNLRGASGPIVQWDTGGLQTGGYKILVLATPKPGTQVSADEGEIDFSIESASVAAGDPVSVTLRRTNTGITPDLPLWVVIKASSEAISFQSYLRFMDAVLCGINPATGQFDPNAPARQSLVTQVNALKRALPYNDADAYRLLKVATEAFLMVNTAVSLAQFPFTQEQLDAAFDRISADGRRLTPSGFGILWNNYLEKVNGVSDPILPYLFLVQQNLKDVRIKNSLFSDFSFPEECFGVMAAKLLNPCLLELIWSYWHEEGMLVQTLNAVTLRFQNVRASRGIDPLAMHEIDPLRPLNNLLWGYIQDEQHRLSVVRRAYEYDHHYGLTLRGRALPPLRTADSRSKFLEAFHHLLYLCSIFFKEDDDTTVIADGFPLLNALKEVHLLLSEGAHNQFGDLPSTARQEMLIQQWLLARPEFREFLPTRIMVAYPEPWMSRVDAMKSLQGWTDVSSLQFRNLGVFGERLLLSIRFGAWSDVDDPAQASNWARFWRGEAQGYIHSYRAVTGVDLSAEITDSRQAALRSAQPALLLQQRLNVQRQRLQLTR